MIQTENAHAHAMSAMDCEFRRLETSREGSRKKLALVGALLLAVLACTGVAAYIWRGEASADNEHEPRSPLTSENTSPRGGSAELADESSRVLYITFHGGSGGGVNQILRFGMDGTLLGHVLKGADPDELRSMALVGNQLFVTNSNKDESKVLIFGPCTSSGDREYVSTFASSKTDPNLVHPYGLASGFFGSATSLFVTNQDTNTLTKYKDASAASTSEPFYKVGNGEGVRGVAFDTLTNTVYIADSEGNRVIAVNAFNSETRWILEIASPIGLHMNQLTRELFISSKASKQPMVRSYNVLTRSWGLNYTHHSITHPAGILVNDGLLYVLCQDKRSLATFDAKSGAYGGTLIDNFDDAPEQLLLSPC